jgi:hypothetical protein
MLFYSTYDNYDLIRTEDKIKILFECSKLVMDSIE